MKLTFEPNKHGGSNFIAEINEAAYFSFHPSACQGWGRLFAPDEGSGGAETAIVLDRKFYILTGDFRKEYAKAYETGGMKACCELFAKMQPEYGSSWTTGEDPSRLIQKLLDNL